MKYRAVLALLVLIAGTGAVLYSGTAESKDTRQTNRDDRLHTLLTERRETLSQLLDAVMANYRAGSTSLENVIRAKNGLLNAELELATTSVERIRIQEERLKNFRELENAVKQHFLTGQAQNEELLEAKAARLAAEIQLLREQAAAD